MSLRNNLARKPPMGWNSYDGYNCSVTEREVRANAEFMARQLARFGWQYVVVDFGWSFSTLPLDEKSTGVEWIDSYGRQSPDPLRFPSAAGGAGFKPLARDIHELGLRFGIHFMRGMPRVAVERNLPILGTNRRAQEIADKVNVCTWSGVKYGVDTSKPGAQEYYDSVVALAADWGVDFIKWDDMSTPYQTAEIEAASNAIRKCGRPIILSLSPGDKSNLPNSEQMKNHCEMWRISPDVWDEWRHVKVQFDLAPLWAPHAGPGHWPDADMLPIGHLSLRDPFRPERLCKLAHDEQRTLITLWVICRSPLMIGGDLPTIDAFALSLLTNPEALSANQNSTNNREFLREGDAIVWTADAIGSPNKYLALFNVNDSARAKIDIHLKDLGIAGRCHVRDLWKKTGAGHVKAIFAATIPPHGAGLYKIERER